MSWLNWALLGLMSCAPDAPPVVQAPAESTNRELVLVFDLHLLHRGVGAWLPTGEIRLPMYEWKDEEGQWNVEMLEGTGTVTGIDPSGKEVPVPIRARFEKFLGDPLIVERSTPTGRYYSLRGELYLTAPDWPLVEVEYAVGFRVPEADGAWTGRPAMGMPAVTPEVLMALGPLIDEVQAAGLGGGIIAERTDPVWGRPPPPLPLFGLLVLREGTAHPATRTSTTRDADMLVGRLLYVRNDYGMAVRGGEVIDPSEYDEQGRLLQDARLLAARLPLSKATRDAIADLGNNQVDKVDPSVVVAGTTAAVDAIRRELWLELEQPDASRVAEGAGIYAARCAGCHGPEGEGPPASLTGLDPLPPPLARVDVAAAQSPQRAFQIATFGVPGTAMASFAQELSDAERWAVAFHVLTLGVDADTPLPTNLPPRALEDLGSMSNAELVDSLGPQTTAGALAFWRGPAITAAAASPWLAARRHVRAVAGGDRAACAELGSLLEPLQASLPVATRDRLARELAAVEAQLATPAGPEMRAAAATLAGTLRAIELGRGVE